MAGYLGGPTSCNFGWGKFEKNCFESVCKVANNQVTLFEHKITLWGAMGGPRGVPGVPGGLKKAKFKGPRRGFEK